LRGGCYCQTPHPEYLRKMGVPEGYCGTCDACGEPGHARHYPGPVPVTAAYCHRHYDELARSYHPEDWAPDDKRYFKSPTERLDTMKPVTAFYEFHGNWCVRQVEVIGTGERIFRSARDEGWARVCEMPLSQIPTDDPHFPLSTSSREEFEQLWAKAEPNPREQ